MKPKPLTEAQFLAFLEKALRRVLPDLTLRAAVQEAVSKEIRLHNNVASFTRFAEESSVPDLKPETVAELQEQIASTFGSEATVAMKADEEGKGLGVEITLPDRTISSEIKVAAGGVSEDDGLPKAPFVPFPVTLPQDSELVWVLARREDLGADEAGRALANIEEAFWASKTGQQFQRKGGEKTFAEFIANVPATALLESGLKRHYKEPETIHSLRSLGPQTASSQPQQFSVDNVNFEAA